MFIQKIRSFATSVTIIFSLSGLAFAATPRFAYVPNIDDGTISEFVVNAATGQLLPNGYVTAGDHPRSFVKVGNFAYVANMNSGDISAYSLDQNTGQLAPLSTPSYLAPGEPFALIAHPNGKFLYAVDSLGGSVYVFRIDSDGSLHQLSTMTAGTSPRFLAITGSGSFLYVANFGSNNVTAYKVSATTGLLTHVGTYATGGSKPSNVMTSGSFLYVTNSGSNNVSAFVTNSTSGALTHVSGSPFATGTSPYALTREFSGHFIYIGNSLSNNVSAFKVNQSTGALTHVTGSPFAATKGTQALKVDPSNKFLYAADAGAEEVMVYSMNKTTGALTNTSSIRTHGIGFDIYVTNGSALSIQPSIAYVMNNDNNVPFNDFPLATYKINPTTGALTSLASTIDTADIDLISSDRTGKLLYQYSSGFQDSPFVSVCLVHSGGTCTNGAGFTAGFPQLGADDPQGKYHYSGDEDFDLGFLGTNGYKLSISANSLSVSLIPGSPYPAFFGDPVGFDLSGKFVYFDSGSVYKVNAADGALTCVGSSGNIYPSGGSALLHPSGRFLYSPTMGGLLAEGINPGNGTLTTLSFSATINGTPLFDQTGRFAYISNGAKINLYHINKTTGALTKISTLLTTAASAQIDPSGNFLFLLLNGTVDQNGNSLTPTLVTDYKINHSTGALTLAHSISFPTMSFSGYSLATTISIH